MSFQVSINAYFVCTSNKQNEKELDAAYNCLKAQMPEERIRTIRASDGFPLISAGNLTKQDVFIFDKFEGDFFEQLQLTKSLIIGTRCLLYCLMHNEPIPRGKSPIFNCAMRELQISATGISVANKQNLKQLVQWMGGLYFPDFSRNITHLVSNTICSNKYEVATLNGIPVMHVDWVKRVWDRANVEDISATDEEFDKYRLPIFFNLSITCTGLDKSKKDKIMQLINENGGVFERTFRSHQIDIVIAEKNHTDTDKYKAAVRYKKDILSPEWIFDSVQKGFALPTKPYYVKALKSSTPTKTDQSIADFTATDQTNITGISVISNVERVASNSLCSINETMMPASGLKSTMQQQLHQHSQNQKKSKDVLKRKASANYMQVFEQINAKDAKKAGNFLDGCCVYLSGFMLEEREKLNRILNVGGATRYDVLNDKLTHIIVGTLDDNEVKSWKKSELLQSSVHIVQLDWLLESIKQRQPAAEAAYYVSTAAATSNAHAEPSVASPSSRRTLHSMQHSFKQPDLLIKKKLFDENQSTLKQFAIVPPQAHSTEMPLEVDDDVATQEKENTPLKMKSATMVPLANVLDYDVDDVDTEMLLGCYSQNNLPVAPLPTAAQLKTSTTDTAATVTPPQPQAMATGDDNEVDYSKLNFFRGATVYLDRQQMPEEFYTQLHYECEAAQGNMVDSNFKETVEYAVVSFQEVVDINKLPVKANIVITDLYLEECIRANKLCSIKYYHKPIPLNARLKPLQDMILVPTIYTNLERDYLESLCTLMGGIYKTTYVRKDRALLLCPVSEGSKYNGAIKWQYPVVTAEWLVQCAEQGKKLPYDDYLVGQSVANFPPLGNISALSSCSSVVQTMERQLQQLEMDSAAAANPADNLPEIDVTPVRNKRLTELAVAAESPHTPTQQNYAGPSYDFEAMEKLANELGNEKQRVCLLQVIDEMRNNQTPELERIKRRAWTPINQTRLPTSMGIPKFCETPEFQRRMVEELEKRWHLPVKKLKPDTPLHVIRRRMLHALCRAVGINVSDDEDNNTKATLTETSKANSCRNATTAANETDMLIPDTQTPLSTTLKKSNNSCSPSQLISAAQRASFGCRSTTINFDNIDFDDSKLEQSKKRSLGNNMNASNSPELKQLSDYLQQCRTRQSVDKRNVQPIPVVDGLTDTEGHYLQPFESEQLCVGSQNLIDWGEPKQMRETRKSRNKRTMQYKGTPRFSLSCCDSARRDVLINKILHLGGEISDNIQAYDDSCSHFLNERPNRGERTLGCIAAGKWLLSLHYIEECFAQDTFIDEEYFEFGNIKALEMPALSVDEQSIAVAANRWRKQLAKSSGERNGAFAKQRVILRCGEKTADALKNVLRAGGAEIIEVKFPLSESDAVVKVIGKATHCYVDMNRAPITERDIKLLQQHGVAVLQHIFINMFLTQETPAVMEKYLLQIA